MGAIHSFAGRLKSAFGSLSRPHASITDSAQRRKAAFLSATLAFSVPFGLVSTLARMALDSTYYDSGLVALGGIFALSTIYLLSRTPQVILAGWLACLATIGTAVAIAVSAREGWVLIAYLATAIVLASILLSPRGTISIAVIAILTVLASGSIQPVFAEPLFISAALPFLGIFSMLVTLGVIQRDGIERDRGAELVASEAQFRQAFTVTFDAFAVTRNGTLIECSPTFLSLLTPAAAVGRPVRDCFPEPIRNQIDDALRAAGARELHLGDNGRVTDIEIVTTPIPGRDLVLFALRDLTDRRKRERTLAASERELSLGQIAASVAHEINNPLMFIAAGVELLADAALPSQSRPVLEDVRIGADRIRSIVQDLGVLSSPRESFEGGVDLNQVITLAARMTSRELETHGQLVLELGGLPAIEGSTAKLGQVFVNLIVNAARSLTDGASDLKRVTARTYARDGFVVAEVEDTGGGISPEIMPHIFEPFFTTRAPGSGTGLGLAICRSIVAAHGGQMEVKSGAAGSRFTVILPATQGQKKAALRQVPVPSPVADIRGLRIVVIDDEPVLLRLFTAFLAGHEVYTAADPAQGLALVRAHAPDLVLCDLTMPGLSGKDVYLTLMREGAVRPGRFAIISGGAINDEAAEFLQAFPGRTLQKPVRRATLEALVRDIISEDDAHPLVKR